VPVLKEEGTKKIDDETFPSNFNTAIIKLPEAVTLYILLNFRFGSQAKKEHKNE